MTETITDTANIVADGQHLRMLIDHIDDPVWLVDTNLSIIECNSAFSKWVSYFIGCTIGKGDHVLFEGRNKLYQEKYESCYQLALNGTSFRSVEDMLINNQLHYTTVTFNPVFDADRKVTGVSCHARDITEHRKHLLRIEEQNAALREIAFIESHKVRGPVSTIMGLEQLFNYEDRTDPTNSEIIGEIGKVIKKLDAIVREVVRLSDEIGLHP